MHDFFAAVALDHTLRQFEHNSGNITILTSENFNSWQFSLDPSYRRGRVNKLKFCLRFRHHFDISNIWPSNHPRITSDPTYYTSLERGRHQQWQVMTMTKTKTNTKTKTKTKTKLLKDPTYAIFLKMMLLKDINYNHNTYHPMMPLWWQWQRQTQRQRQND